MRVYRAEWCAFTAWLRCCLLTATVAAGARHDRRHAMTRAAFGRRAVIRIGRGRARQQARSPLAGVIFAGTALAIAASGCATGHASGASPASSAPSFGPVPATSASPEARTGVLAKGVLASIPADSALSIGFGFGSVWVSSHRSNQLTRIDPATGKIVATIDTGMNSCGSVGTGLGRVWVSGCMWDNATVVVNPVTNQVAGQIPHHGLAIGFDAGSAWIASGPGQGGGWTYRINPRTLEVQARIKAAGSWVVFGFGSAWVVNEATGTVSRIDPATNRVIATIPAGLPGADDTDAVLAAGRLLIYPSFQNPLDVTQAGYRIWRINPHGDTATEGTLAGLRDLPILFNHGTLAAGMGSIWVRGWGTPVFRYDARTLRLLGKYPADPSAGGYVAVGFGSLWVANVDTSTLWQDRIAG